MTRIACLCLWMKISDHLACMCVCVWPGNTQQVMGHTFMLIEEILKCCYASWLTEPFKRQEFVFLNTKHWKGKVSQVLALTVLQIVPYSCVGWAGELTSEMLHSVSMAATCKASSLLPKFLTEARHGLSELCELTYSRWMVENSHESMLIRSHFKAETHENMFELTPAFYRCM